MRQNLRETFFADNILEFSLLSFKFTETSSNMSNNRTNVTSFLLTTLLKCPESKNVDGDDVRTFCQFLLRVFRFRSPKSLLLPMPLPPLCFLDWSAAAWATTGRVPESGSHLGAACCCPLWPSSLPPAWLVTIRNFLASASMSMIPPASFCGWKKTFISYLKICHHLWYLYFT